MGAMYPSPLFRAIIPTPSGIILCDTKPVSLAKGYRFRVSLNKTIMKTITIDGVEYAEKSASLPEIPVDTAPFSVGTAYIIRTVTHTYTGRLTWVSDKELVLEDAAWVADSGRWMNAIKDGTLDEVEPMGTVIVGRGAIIDATVWTHPLPKEQK